MARPCPSDRVAELATGRGGLGFGGRNGTRRRVASVVSQSDSTNIPYVSTQRVHSDRRRNPYAVATFLLGVMVAPLLVSIAIYNSNHDGLTTVSLVLVSLACVTLSSVVMHQVRRSNGTQVGRLMATTGLILSLASLTLWLLLMEMVRQL